MFMKRVFGGVDGEKMKNIGGIKGVFFQYHPDIDILRFHYSGVSCNELDFWKEVKELSSNKKKHLLYPEGGGRIVLITVGKNYLPCKETFEEIQKNLCEKGFTGLLTQNSDLFLRCSRNPSNFERICFSLGLSTTEF